MPILYATFIKHATKVTKCAGATRPFLQGIYHRSDGSLIVTDGYRLYQAFDVYDGTENKIINPVTGDVLEEDYPSTDQLIPTTPKATFTIAHLAEQSKLIKLLWEAARYPANLNDKPDNKKFALIKIVSRAGRVFVEPPDDRAMYASLLIGEINGEIELTVNAGFLFEALDLFQDCGFHSAEVEYNGDLKPLVFRQDKLLALILPVRKF